MYLLEKITPEKRVAAAYLLLSLLYIFFSDKLVDFVFFHSGMVTTAQTYKGFAFVIASSSLIYFLTKGKSAAVQAIEQQSAKTEAFYRALITQSGDVTMLTGSDGKVTFVSENVGKMLGYSREEWLTYNAFDLVHPDELPALIAFNEDVIKQPGIPFYYEARVRHKDGDYIWMEGTIVNRLDDPKIKGILTTARSTEKRKRAEERLQESERMFRAAFEQLAVGMANISLAGDWVTTNEHLCALTGYTQEELAQVKYWDLAGPEKPIALLDFEKVIFGDRERCCQQRCIVRKDGARIHVEQMLTLITDDEGTPLYVALVLKDVEAATLTKTELAYKNRELDTFIYRSSHDLRGPITTLLGLTDVALAEISDDKAGEYFRNCNNVALKMKNTLDNLMSVTYLKHRPAEMEDVKLTYILENVLARKSISARMHDATFIPEIEQSAVCHTNSNLLSVIIRHLLSNAFTFRKQDTEHKVYLNINVAEDRTGIYVMDNGIGIDINDREHIYDLYYRGKSADRGSGVGLYIVKLAVEKLGGTIAMESDPGYGTRFMVTLPNGGEA